MVVHLILGMCLIKADLFGEKESVFYFIYSGQRGFFPLAVLLYLDLPWHPQKLESLVKADWSYF